MGTYFEPRTDRLAARKRWIAFALPVQGAIAVDAGARRALVERGKSLLPSGVLTVNGQFARRRRGRRPGRGRPRVRPGHREL